MAGKRRSKIDVEYLPKDASINTDLSLKQYKIVYNDGKGHSGEVMVDWQCKTLIEIAFNAGSDSMRDMIREAIA